MPSIIQSFIVVFARLIIQFPSEILNFLIGFNIQNKIGLKILMDKWLLLQPLFKGLYIKNVTLQGLSHLFSMKNNLVESLMVIGFNPSHFPASIGNQKFLILTKSFKCHRSECTFQNSLNFNKNVK